jgi:uncharacterized protein
MSHIVEFAILTAVAFVAATVAGVTGFGGAAILLPVLVFFFETRDAIPILTVVQLVGNGSRVWFNRRSVDLAVVKWFALGGVPAAIAGGILFAKAPLAVLTRFLGGFLILLVVWRHTRRAPLRMPLRGFAWLGAGASFLSALVGSVGPLMAPFFLGYGLVKTAYIGTEALTTVIMHMTKLVVYGQNSLLTANVIWVGVALGPVMVLGSFVGKRIVERLPERVFILVIEVTLVVAGGLFLWRG